MSETRILVVEDEPNIRDIVEVALRFHGFRVTAVGTGAAALGEVLKNQPDLVVLDVMLPDIDGFEVCRRIRADGVHPPVIFLTARDAVADTVRGLTLGGDDYVTKPFSVEALVARIRAVLRRTTVPHGGRTRPRADPPGGRPGARRGALGGAARRRHG